MIPKYADGLVAIRPLMLGPVLLGLAWPTRQMLIAVGRPWRLLAATLAGLALATGCVWWGTQSGTLEGVAWGMSLGGFAVYTLTSIVGLAPVLGVFGWVCHQVRIGLWLGWFAAVSLTAVQVRLDGAWDVVGLAERAGILAVLGLPPMLVWAARQGVFRRFRGEAGG